MLLKRSHAAAARPQVDAPYAHWDIPRIGQAYVLFRGRLAPPYSHGPGPESLETRLFAPQVCVCPCVCVRVCVCVCVYATLVPSDEWLPLHYGSETSMLIVRPAGPTARVRR